MAACSNAHPALRTKLSYLGIPQAGQALHVAGLQLHCLLLCVCDLSSALKSEVLSLMAPEMLP